MTDLDGLIAEARSGKYLTPGERYELIVHRLADALEAATEEVFKKAEAFDKAVALSERRQTLLEEVEAERDAALARIAELEAELEVAMRPHSECERSGAEAGERIIDLEGDLAGAEARIAEAAKLHKPDPQCGDCKDPIEATCHECMEPYPCPTLRALGLNEGGNEDD